MKKYNSKISMKKADDWTRRAFLKRAGLFMTAFGVPYVWRMEALEKVSKRIFGSSLAFAQTGGNTFLLSFRMRAGWPADNCIADREDAVGALNLDRNFHATGANVVTIAPSGTMKQPLYLPPQAYTGDAATDLAGNMVTPTNGIGGLTPVAGSKPFAERIAKLTACRNVNGHTNMFGDSLMNGGANGSNADFFVSHSAKMFGLNATVLSNGIVYGSQNAADFSTVGGEGSAYSPIYVDATTEIQGLFQPTTLRASDSSVLSESVVGEIFDVVQGDMNEAFLKTIETREGHAALQAGNEAMAALLKQNLAALLNPVTDTTTAGFITTLNGAATPNQRFGTGTEPLNEQVALALRCFQLGITNSFGHVINSGDWHNSQAGPGTNNQNQTEVAAGDNTVQAQHARWFGTFMPRLLNLADQTQLQGSTDMIGPKLRVVITSEFARTIPGSETIGDNGDGGHCAVIMVGNGLNGGSYGDHSPALQSVSPDITTGAPASAGQLDQRYRVHTIRKFIGVDYDQNSVVAAITD